MQKSKKSIFIIFIFIILLIVIFLIYMSINNQKDLTLAMYDKLNTSQKYTITIEGEDDGYRYVVTRAQRVTDISIDTKSEYEDDEEHTTTLVTDKNAYYIMHNEQEYTTLDSEDIEIDVLLPKMKDIDGKEYQKGKEVIQGKTYYYEEYENIETFLILIDVGEEGKLKNKFYYENGKIAYIRNIVELDGEILEELLKVKCVYDSEDNLFEIPEDYAELE